MSKLRDILQYLLSIVYVWKAARTGIIIIIIIIVHFLIIS